MLRIRARRASTDGTANGPSATRASRLHFVSRIGVGARGQIFRATTPEGKAVAVKVLSRDDEDTTIELAALLRVQPHPHIIGVQGRVEYTATEAFLVLELADSDLLDAITDAPGGRLDETTAARYFVQLLKALRHCHKRGVYHLDLKPENVLLKDVPTEIVNNPAAAAAMAAAAAAAGVRLGVGGAGGGVGIDSSTALGGRGTAATAGGSSAPGATPSSRTHTHESAATSSASPSPSPASGGGSTNNSLNNAFAPTPPFTTPVPTPNSIISPTTAAAMTASLAALSNTVVGPSPLSGSGSAAAAAAKKSTSSPAAGSPTSPSSSSSSSTNVNNSTTSLALPSVVASTLQRNVKLCDFGSASLHRRTSRACGSLYYAAPEVLPLFYGHSEQTPMAGSTALAHEYVRMLLKEGQAQWDADHPEKRVAEKAQKAERAAAAAAAASSTSATSARVSTSGSAGVVHTAGSAVVSGDDEFNSQAGRGVTDAASRASGGSVRSESPPSSDSSDYGTPRANGRYEYDAAAADVWSLGVLLHVMLAGRPPFGEASMYDAGFVKLLRGTFSFPPHFSPAVQRLLRGMLRVRPRDRFTLADVSRDAWVTPFTQLHRSLREIRRRFARSVRAGGGVGVGIVAAYPRRGDGVSANSPSVLTDGLTTSLQGTGARAGVGSSSPLHYNASSGRTNTEGSAADSPSPSPAPLLHISASSPSDSRRHHHKHSATLAWMLQQPQSGGETPPAADSGGAGGFSSGDAMSPAAAAGSPCAPNSTATGLAHEARSLHELLTASGRPMRRGTSMIGMGRTEKHHAAAVQTRVRSNSEDIELVAELGKESTRDGAGTLSEGSSGATPGSTAGTPRGGRMVRSPGGKVGDSGHSTPFAQVAAATATTEKLPAVQNDEEEGKDRSDDDDYGTEEVEVVDVDEADLPEGPGRKERSEGKEADLTESKEQEGEESGARPPPGLAPLSLGGKNGGAGGGGGSGARGPLGLALGLGALRIAVRKPAGQEEDNNLAALDLDSLPDEVEGRMSRTSTRSSGIYGPNLNPPGTVSSRSPGAHAPATTAAAAAAAAAGRMAKATSADGTVPPPQHAHLLRGKTAPATVAAAAAAAGASVAPSTALKPPAAASASSSALTRAPLSPAHTVITSPQPNVADLANAAMAAGAELAALFASPLTAPLPGPLAAARTWGVGAVNALASTAAGAGVAGVAAAAVNAVTAAATAAANSSSGRAMLANLPQGGFSFISQLDAEARAAVDAALASRGIGEGYELDTVEISTVVPRRKRRSAMVGASSSSAAAVSAAVAAAKAAGETEHSPPPDGADLHGRTLSRDTAASSPYSSGWGSESTGGYSESEDGDSEFDDGVGEGDGRGYPNSSSGWIGRGPGGPGAAGGGGGGGGSSSTSGVSSTMRAAGRDAAGKPFAGLGLGLGTVLGRPGASLLRAGSGAGIGMGMGIGSPGGGKEGGAGILFGSVHSGSSDDQSAGVSDVDSAQEGEEEGGEEGKDGRR